MIADLGLKMLNEIPLHFFPFCWSNQLIFIDVMMTSMKSIPAQAEEVVVEK